MHRSKFLSGFRPVITRNTVLCDDIVLYVPPIYQSLLIDKYEDGSILLKSDIDLFLNQNRLSSLGEDNVRKIFDSLASSSSSVSDVRKNISDDDLLKFCKSRYLQSPSELRAWCDYLGSSMSELVNKSVSPTSSPEPTPSPEPTV